MEKLRISNYRTDIPSLYEVLQKDTLQALRCTCFTVLEGMQLEKLSNIQRLHNLFFLTTRFPYSFISLFP